jgi:hypothetical protein
VTATPITTVVPTTVTATADRTAIGKRLMERDRMGESHITTARDEQVTCDALRLALVATELRVAWHAGAISAERAMEMLDRASCEIHPRHTDSVGQLPCST